MINFNVFPNATRHIVTMSYDDANLLDIRLAELFNKYGIKGTFNVNTDGDKSRVRLEDYKEVYKGHEVAVHTVTHPYLENVAATSVISEILENRKAIEENIGYPVRGMAYPFGTYNDRVIEIAKACGIVYSRTTKSNGFKFPENFMEWHPSCHHNDAEKLADQLVLDLDLPWRTDLLYIWGHSHELKTQEDWDRLENILKKISGHKQVWYATNIEIYDYITAQRALVISADESMVYNPSAIEVWFKKGWEVYSVKPGETIKTK